MCMFIGTPTGGAPHPSPGNMAALLLGLFIAKIVLPIGVPENFLPSFEARNAMP